MTDTATVPVTSVLTYSGQPLQHGELQTALNQYRRRKETAKVWMRGYRAKPKEPARG